MSGERTKIQHVEADLRRKCFRVTARGKEHIVPFAKLPAPPSEGDPLEEVFVDAELGCEAFTYRLRSGVEDSIPFDAVREVTLDPEYLQELFLHRLTVEARDGLAKSGLGKRQVARLLGTSPSQLYRLLDTTNHSKSLGQMLALLYLVDREVKITVRARRRSGDAITEEELEVVPGREASGPATKR